MVIGFDVGEKTNHDSPIKDFPLKSHFLDLDEREVEHVNKRGQRIKKNVELWARNAFDDYKVFHGFDTMKSITYLSKDEFSIKYLVDMISSFVLQVVKKDGNMYIPIK
jgi:hypothetical protein